MTSCQPSGRNGRRQYPIGRFAQRRGRVCSITDQRADTGCTSGSSLRLYRGRRHQNCHRASRSVGRRTSGTLSPSTSSGNTAAESASMPSYLATIKDFSIQTVCIKGYERRATATFPRDEFYAYRVMSM